VKALATWMSVSLLVACATAPPPIAEAMRGTPAGQVTVVEFVDFECIFCRRAHASISAVVARHLDGIRLVRKQVPLTRRHPHALAAARASLCADGLGKGDAMADALFRAAPAALTPEGIEVLAADVGMDAAALHTCVAASETTVRLAQDRADFDEIEGDGVPIVYVGTERLDGVPDEATFEAAVVRGLAAR
jgi:protein-disulfide isomerase